MSVVPDIPPVPSGPPDRPAPSQTQSAQGRARGPAGMPPPESVRRPRAVLATVGFSALLALSAYADPALLAMTVGLVGLVLAWGWHDLFRAPVPTVPRLITGALAVAGPAVVALTPDEPYLRWEPVVVAAGLLAILLHQLVRTDGRPRLTESLAIGVGALAVLTCGVPLVPLVRMYGGPDVLAATAAAVALACLADLLVGRRRLHAWTLPVAMLLGGWAATAAAFVTGTPRIGQALLLGFLVGGVSHAMRRLLAPLAPMAWARSQLAAASASLLVVGVVVNVLARVLLTR